ncbi:histidine kinase N-terminal 7TM domain-containing protein [Halogranum rubrum]|nr:histidine kinase N-terminal 7TM domain-containing protein [Halogranum salarium]
MPYVIATVAVLLLTALVAAGLVVVARRHREISGSNWFAAVMVTVFLWSVIYALQLSSTDPTQVLRWHTLKYVPVIALPYAWFAFTMAYSGHTRFLSRRWLVGLALVPTISLVLVLTNDVHHVFWTARTPTGEFGAPGDVNGPGFWLHAVYSYTLILVGTLSIGWSFIRARTLYRGQTAILIAATFLPWIANALHLLEWLPLSDLDPTPVALAVTGLLFVVAVHYYRFLDLVPVAWELARDVAIEDMADGAIVLDVRNRIIDLNSTATTIFGFSRADATGRPLEDVSAVCVELVETDTSTSELETFVDHEWRYYELQRSPLSTTGGRHVGHLITLHDITERKTREQRLEVQNRLLRHNLRNDLNVVLGYLELLDETLDDDDQREFLHRATNKGETLLQRSEKSRRLGKLIDRQIQLETVTLACLLDETLAICCDRFPDVELTTTLPSDLHVLADDGLTFVVLELVENAAEHTDGDCHVEISATATDDGVELRIADDGPGIPPHEQAVLASGRETPLEHSTGIGLWLVRWMVTRYGGSVRIEDNEPRGSIVVLSLNRTEPTEKTLTAPPGSDVVGGRSEQRRDADE